ncbi:unnamed protein product [Sphagnum balticum]
MATTTCATCATTTTVAGGGGGGGGPQLLLKETPKAGGRGKKKQFQVVMRTAATTLENTRISLLRALSTQAASQSRRSIENLAKEVVKYTNPRKSEARNLEEALMTVPDLETIPYTVIRQEQDFEIREVKSYVVAETVMPGRSGFDFVGSGQAFNTLAAYLFGKNTKETEMAMTTPVVTQRVQSEGFVTDDDVRKKEEGLRRAILRDGQVRVKANAQPEVAQYNPPFTPPFMRRNELALEVEELRGFSAPAETAKLEKETREKMKRLAEVRAAMATERQVCEELRREASTKGWWSATMPVHL